MSARWCLLLPCVTACGRIAFDPRADAFAQSADAMMQITVGDRASDGLRGVVSDVALWGFNAANNYGLGTESSIQGDIHNLMQFDLSSLAGWQVIDARVELVIVNSGDIAPGNVTVHRVLEAWSEGTGNGQPGAPNWTERTASAAWSTIGGTLGAALMTMSFGSSPGPFEWPLDVGVVQSWIDDPASNDGIALATAGAHYHFNTSEAGDLGPHLSLSLAR